MKKLLLTLIITLITLSSMAQSYELYRCTKIGSREQLDDGKWSQWTYNPAELILRMCVDDLKLEINDKKKSVFYISNLSSKEERTDYDGDKYIMTEWTGYDEDGLKCHLVSIDWPELTDRHFILKYANFEISFKCAIVNQKKRTSSNGNII